ncbi:aspartate/methionine/tyrosine aminotransferase [Roseiarcus fermentans]|uniref:aspartate transaminase n=1 Tax=Roseiarcus fermentans TaxID=1473586 RepID=A0A366FU45_9HYPH|nr:pyridoxal phosphate-dependent aminotransferase [Roseiarcus fermentans]RBP17219.1 aspartate/methionine/tyrosine aminotransferase [Roseiarcus fermentans]
MTIATVPDRNWLAEIPPAALNAAPSGIVEVFDYGRGRQGLIPLWVGEGDQPPPRFVTDAAKASLDGGETFYTYQGGIPELREAIAAYMTRCYGAAPGGGAFRPETFFATIGGMHAIEIATRLTLGPGDEALIPSPAWPNFCGAIETSGARAVPVPLGREGRWSLDVERLAAAVTPATKAIFLNSPANPTGFIATAEEIAATLALSRRHDLWIIADEIYGRLTYDGARAPSFHDVMAPDDKILFVQTLSKNWAMTGFRVGWLEAPAALGPIIENLVQFTSSGVPVFTQRAGVAALNQGEAFLADQIERCRRSRDILCEGLLATGRVRFFEPEAAFYLFFAIDGFPDSRALALRLIDEAGVGAAPGSAFGPGGEGFLRICFARNPGQIAEATRRIVEWLRT